MKAVTCLFTRSFTCFLFLLFSLTASSTYTALLNSLRNLLRTWTVLQPLSLAISISSFVVEAVAKQLFSYLLALVFLICSNWCQGGGKGSTFIRKKYKENINKTQRRKGFLIWWCNEIKNLYLPFLILWIFLWTCEFFWSSLWSLLLWHYCLIVSFLIY